MRARDGLLPLIVLAVACGGPVQFTIAEDLGCSMTGPREVKADHYDVIVSGFAQVGIHKLGDTVTVTDVEAHVEAVGSATNPPGTTRLYRIRNEPRLHGDRSAQNSASRRVELTPGTYVFLCDWEAGGGSGREVVGSVRVIP